MRIKIDSEELRENLSVLNQLKYGQTRTPEITKIFARCDDCGNLILVKSNLQTTIVRRRIPVKVVSAGECLLPSDIADYLRDGSVDIEVDGCNIIVKNGNAEYSVTTADHRFYPKSVIDAVDYDYKPVSIIRKSNLVTAIQRTLFCVADEDTSREYLKGVHFKSSSRGITVSSSDGYRLSVCNIDGEAEETDNAIIVPKNSAVIVGGNAFENYFNVMITVSESRVAFLSSDTTVISELTKTPEPYPNISSLFSEESGRVANIKASELLYAVNRVIKSNKGMVHITTSKLGDGVRLNVISADPYRRTSDDKLVASIGNVSEVGEEASFCLSPRFLFEFLSNIEPDCLISISYQENNDSVKLVSQADQNYYHLIKPMSRG